MNRAVMCRRSLSELKRLSVLFGVETIRPLQLLCREVCKRDTKYVPNFRNFAQFGTYFVVWNVIRVEFGSTTVGCGPKIFKSWVICLQQWGYTSDNFSQPPVICVL